MNRSGDLLLGVAIGATLMYFFDPIQGRRRRALVRDQFVHGAHEVEDFGGEFASRARHFRNKARGVVFEARSRFRHDEIDDPVLEARVRSHLGRIITDSSAIEVSAEHGRVTLRGTAAEADMSSLVESVQSVPGVHDVINRLQARENAG